MSKKFKNKRSKTKKLPKRVRVILLTKLDNLGDAGEIKLVKPGYARNYLLPRKLAELATASAVNSLEKRKTNILKGFDKNKEGALLLKEKIEKLSSEFLLDSTIGGVPYGSLTKKEIVEELKKSDIIIDKNQLKLLSPIKSFGEFELPVQLMAEVVAALKIKISAK